MTLPAVPETGMTSRTSAPRKASRSSGAAEVGHEAVHHALVVGEPVEEAQGGQQAEDRVHEDRGVDRAARPRGGRRRAVSVEAVEGSPTAGTATGRTLTSLPSSVAPVARRPDTGTEMTNSGTGPLPRGGPTWPGAHRRRRSRATSLTVAPCRWARSSTGARSTRAVARARRGPVGRFSEVRAAFGVSARRNSAMAARTRRTPAGSRATARRRVRVASTRSRVQ